MANKWKETIEKWGLEGNPFTPLPPEIDNVEKLKQIFTGRRDEISHICGLIDPPRGFFIYGMFGVGKTILIQEAFRKLKHHGIITVYTIFDPHDGFLKYIVPKQKSYKIENPFSMWGWINARKLHPLCKGIEI